MEANCFAVKARMVYGSFGGEGDVMSSGLAPLTDVDREREGVAVGDKEVGCKTGRESMKWGG